MNKTRSKTKKTMINLTTTQSNLNMKLLKVKTNSTTHGLHLMKPTPLNQRKNLNLTTVWQLSPVVWSAMKTKLPA